MAEDSEDQQPASAPNEQPEKAIVPSDEATSGDQPVAAPEAAPAPTKPAPKQKAAKKTKKAEAPAAEPVKENLSLDPNDVEKPKIVKAKGSKNIHSGFAHMLS